MTKDFQKPAEGSSCLNAHSGLSAGRARSDIGSVVLVGAGPGDPELLTLKAVRALQSADIILFDHLVSKEILDLARAEAKRMLVGKRARQPSCCQKDINALMIKLAHQGKRVVRLKSGDPMIFGRAGEEIAELRAHQIPVTVVPGVTAASAMAASLNVSLTHRDHAHSVRYVTGHSRKGHLPEDLDWAGLADPGTTTVFYMGGQTASQIAQRLIDEGLQVNTPVVVMAAASQHGETSWHGTVKQLSERAHMAKEALFADGKPVMIGIGHVFKCAAEIEQAVVDHFSATIGVAV